MRLFDVGRATCGAAECFPPNELLCFCHVSLIWKQDFIKKKMKEKKKKIYKSLAMKFCCSGMNLAVSEEDFVHKGT